MSHPSLPACSAAALWTALVVWPGMAQAQSSSFEPLKATGGRFQIIGGSPAGQATQTPMVFTAPSPSGTAPLARPASAPVSATHPAAMPTAPAPAPKIELSPALPTAPGAAPAPPRVAAEDVPPVDLLAAIAGPEPTAVPAPADPIVTASLPPAAAPSVALTAAAPSASEANTRIVQGRNALMAEALRRAQGSLDDFLKAAARPPEGAVGFAVKVALGSREAREVLWLSGLERREQRNILLGMTERWSGQLANEPTEIRGFKIGDRVGFEISEIRDWTYIAADGRPRGNFTACALTAQDGRAKLEELVRTTGLDCDWIEQARRTAAR